MRGTNEMFRRGFRSSIRTIRRKRRRFRKETLFVFRQTPITSSVETCTKRFTPLARAASSRTCVPMMLVRRNSSAEAMLRSTCDSAAKFTRTSVSGPGLRELLRDRQCWRKQSDAAGIESFKVVRITRIREGVQVDDAALPIFV